MGRSGLLGGGGGANIPAMIRENRQFRVTSVSIQERLTADFDRAEEHAQTFESIRPIYEFNANWDYDEYRAQTHDISELKQMLELISNWNKELEKLRNKPIGVLEVDSKRLKNELVPLRESRLQEIKEYIKDLAKERCKTLLEHYKDCIMKLSQKPQHLKDFAAHLNTVSSLREEEKALYKSTSQVDRMYNLLKLYEVSVPSEDLVLHEDLHDRRDEYKREMDSAQGFKETRLPEMVVAVEANISKLQESVAAVVSQRYDD